MKVHLFVSALLLIATPLFALDYECNEKVDFEEFSNCGIEVKCHHPSITGGVELLFFYEPIVGYELEYTFDYGVTLICEGTVVGHVLGTPKGDYKCTENMRGKDGEGDIAVEVQIDLTGCSFNQ